MPADCRHTVVVVPLNYTPYVWGWPNRFVARMKAAGSPVFVMGPYHKGTAFGGIDTVEEFRELPADYGGGIWTDEIETIVPLVRGGN